MQKKSAAGRSRSGSSGGRSSSSGYRSYGGSGGSGGDVNLKGVWDSADDPVARAIAATKKAAKNFVKSVKK